MEWGLDASIDALQQPAERTKGFYNVGFDVKRSFNETRKDNRDVVITGSAMSCAGTTGHDMFRSDSQSSSSEFERRATQKRLRLVDHTQTSSSFRLTSLESWCRRSELSSTDPNVVSQSSLESSSLRRRRCQQFHQNSDQSSLCHVCRRPYAPYLSLQREDSPPPQRNTLLSYFSAIRKSKRNTNDGMERSTSTMMTETSSKFGLELSEPDFRSSGCSHCDRINICHNCRKQCDECKAIFCSFCIKDDCSNIASSSTSIRSICVECSVERTTSNNNPLRLISAFDNDSMDLE